MGVEDWNKKFGWIWLAITPIMGMFITFQFANEGYAESFARTANRLFHAHSGLLAVLNILMGLTIGEAALAENTKKLTGILAVGGTILVSLSFAFLMVGQTALVFPFRLIGGISVIAAVLILAIGMLKK